MNHPCVLHLVLANGSFDGLKIIEKSNWVGKGLACFRTLFPRYRTRPELKKAGIFILVGDRDDERSGKRIYIGEGDPLIAKLDTYYKDKDWWKELIVFTSSDDTLNRTFVQFIEARLVKMAYESGKYFVDNEPIFTEPDLSEKDLAVCEGFLRELLLGLPLVGIHLNKPNFLSEKVIIYAKGIIAEGFETTNGFLVCSGSQAVIPETSNLSNTIKRLRQTLIEDGTLKLEGDRMFFTRDFTFGSPSQAASVILGTSSNGREAWKSEKGETLKSLQLREIL